MTVKVRTRTRNGRTRWVADIHARLPDGTVHRERRDVPTATSQRSALRWARSRERELIRNGTKPKKEARTCPTLAEFADAFIEHVRARGRKPSTIDNHQTNLRVHLLPRFGRVRLDEIDETHVASIVELPRVSPGTRNKILATLSALLRSGKAKGHLREVLRISHIPSPKKPAAFYERADFERLVAAASVLGHDHLAIVLLGGEAGLRAGEMAGLHWRSVQLTRGVIVVEHSFWRGHLTTPKSNRYRSVPLSERLSSLLCAMHPERRGETVLARDDGSLTGRNWIRHRLWQAQSRADLPPKGAHTLRHTFCSHLAELGAPAAEIRDYAGHSSVAVTDRYMHLAPGRRSSIALLDRAAAESKLESEPGGATDRTGADPAPAHRPKKKRK